MVLHRAFCRGSHVCDRDIVFRERDASQSSQSAESESGKQSEGTAQLGEAQQRSRGCLRELVKKDLLEAPVMDETFWF